MKKRKKKNRLFPTILIVITGIVLLIIIFCLYLFRIQAISVIGNRNVGREEIIELSGLNPGDNYLFMNRSDVKKRIERNRYLEYLGCQFDYNGTLVLKVTERRAMGIVLRNGYYYVISESGTILENGGTQIPEGIQCPIILGLSIPDAGIMGEGNLVPVRDEQQLEGLRRVLRALDDTNMLARTTSIELSNIDNITVMTTENAAIVLGNADSLKVKLAIAKEVISIRQEIGDLVGAKIDVSNGSDAHYIPAVLPTITPTPTATPTVEPDPTPDK